MVREHFISAGEQLLRILETKICRLLDDSQMMNHHELNQITGNEEIMGIIKGQDSRR